MFKKGLKEKGLILAVVRGTGLGESQNQQISKFLSQNHIDWKLFEEFAVYHELTPLVYLGLKDFASFLPVNLRELLKIHYYSTLRRSLYFWKEFLQLAGVFEQAGISLLPIKGMAFLGDIYKETFLRPMVDIDLLVKEESIQKAEAILCDLEYKKELFGSKEEYWRKDQCHIAFAKQKQGDSFLVELHWGLDFKRRSRAILPELWERVRVVNRDGRIIKLLSPEDTLFSLALHSRRFGKVLSLKNIYDGALLIKKYRANFDWDYCLRMSRKYELGSSLFFILYQIKFLSDLDFPDYVWKGLKVSAYKRRVIQSFIEENTFLADKNRNLKKSLFKIAFSSL